MDLKLIKNILTLISDSDVDEVSIEEGEFKIKVKKSGAVEYVTYNQPAPTNAPQMQAPSNPGTPPAPTEAAAPAPVAASGDTVKSPIVGTYYEAASPDSDPFIKPGDKVEKGQTLCIIEAMKIMNEIESDYSGTIVEMLVKDGQPVEYDQPLFIIKKD